MFDIGAPEFMIIAVVALIVLGPERLPEVMGKAGRAYRQLREMSNQLTSEFQRQWEEGMREVEDVTSTVNTAWQEATSLTAPGAASLPPPRLVQVPPALRAPTTAAEAGPWAQHAWHQDTAAEVEPQAAAYPDSPFALQRRVPEAVDYDEAGIGGPSLMGPAPVEAEWLPPVAVPETMVSPTGQEPPDGAAARMPEPAAVVSNGTSRHEDLPEVPAADLMDLPTATAERAPERPLALSAAAGAGHTAHTAHAAPRANGQDGDETLTERERTVLEFLQSGGTTIEKAADYLGTTPEALSARLARLALRP